jgi:hypothetical protein
MFWEKKFARIRMMTILANQDYQSDSRENDLLKYCVGFYQLDVASDRGTDHGNAEDS